MKTFNQFNESNSYDNALKNFELLVLYFIKNNKAYFDLNTLKYDLTEKEDKFGNLHAHLKCTTLTLNEDQMPLEDYYNVLKERKKMLSKFDNFIGNFYNKFKYMPFINIEETQDKGTLIVFTSSIEELNSNEEMFNFMRSKNGIKKYNL